MRANKLKEERDPWKTHMRLFWNVINTVHVTPERGRELSLWLFLFIKAAEDALRSLDVRSRLQPLNLFPVLTEWAPRSRWERIQRGCIKSPQANTWVDSDLGFFLILRASGSGEHSPAAWARLPLNSTSIFSPGPPAVSRSNVLLRPERTGGAWCMLD